MKRLVLVLVFFILLTTIAKSEGGFEATLSKGLNFTSSDTTFALRFGLVIQPRMSFYGDLPDCNDCGKNDYLEYEMRRLRLRFDGFIGTPDLTYFVQLGVTRRDMESIQGPDEESTGVIYDAYIDWEFLKKTKLRIGQAKLPGCLSRLMGFGGLNFLERSYAESRFNTYRDIGLQILNEWNIFNDFTIREQIAVSQGEGVNVKTNPNGGLAYSGRLELYPFGLFEKAGETFEMDRQFEKHPKLLIGGAYFLDAGAVRERSVLGKTLYQPRDITQIFGDFLFKWNGFALMGEYYSRTTDDPITINADKTRYVYVGQGFAGQASYMLTKNHAIAFRFSQVQPDEDIIKNTGNRTDLGLGFTHFLFGNKVKMQYDATYYEQDYYEKDPTKNYEIRTNLYFSF
jgi:hypothetical protein